MRLLCACFLLIFGTLTAFAEKREALVFGANNYYGLRHLENADNDAEAIKVTLEKLGFNVTLEEDRDLKHMRRALADFGDDAKGADVALVFYSGHGIEIDGDNRLVPVDADISSLEALKNSTLRLEDVRDVVASATKVGLIVLDACRDDPFGPSTGDGRGAVALTSLGAQTVSAGLGRMGRSENILFAFSAAPGQSASDGAGSNSPFTTALVKYLGTDGLEIRSVLTLVQQDVYDQTRGRQLPYVESGLPKTFFASTTRQQLPERERLLLAMADVTPEIRDDVEKIAAGNDMPPAPLFGALIAADLTGLSADDRDRKLADAAQAFVKTRDALAHLSSSDPQVGTLRAEAETSLSLGAFQQARQALAKAAAIDAQAGDDLAGNLVQRRLSEAKTYVSDAGVAQAQLDYPSAISALETAASLYQRIEAENVSDAARADRDQLLSDLGDLQSLTGNSAAALEAYQSMLKAAQLRQSKAPSKLDAVRDAVVALYKIGDVATQQGNTNAALAAYSSALTAGQRVVARHRNDTDWQRLVELGETGIGDIKLAQGDYSGALASYQLGLSASEKLAKSFPGDAAWARDVMIAQGNIGKIQKTLGDLAGALAAYQRSLDIAEEMAKADPENVTRQRDVGVAQQLVGDVKMAQDDTEGAFIAYQAVLAIAERLAAKDPGNTTWQRDMSVVQQRIGGVKLAQADNAGALAAFSANLDVATRLAATDPNNIGWQRDLAIAQGRIGDVKMAIANSSEALAAYEAELRIDEKVAASDPSNPDWQHAVAAAHGNIGGVQMAQGNTAGALTSFKADLTIGSSLAAAEPANRDWLQDTLFVQEKIGDLLIAQGDTPSAINAYQAELETAEQTAARDPDYPDWQRAVSVAHFKLAKAGNNPRNHFDASLGILVELQRRGLLRPADAMLPQLLKDEIAALPPGK